MKKIRLLRPAVFLVGLSVLFSVSDSTPPLAGNLAEDLVQTVEVFAPRGALKVHGRNETQYRDMAPGSQSLTSGSFLKTAGGQADILLPDNSILSLDANTEVQLGMYENGTLVGQQSGQAWHYVEPREGAGYAVRTRFYTATAIGTEYRTRVNWPVEGAVTVFWGEVGVIGEVTDSQTGERSGYVYSLIPEGHKTIWPADPAASGRLRTGDHETFHAEQGKSVGQRGSPPAPDSWSSRNRTRSQIIRELGRRRRAGLMTPADYRQKLGALLGIGPEVIPNEPLRVQGGLWVGMDAYSDVIKFCVTGNQIDMVSYTGWIYCTDKKTHETYNYRVDFDLDEGVPFLLERNGTYTGGYEFPDGVYKGLTFYMNGFLGGSSGEALIIMFSDNEVAVCNMGPTVIQLTRSPAPCVR